MRSTSDLNGISRPDGGVRSNRSQAGDVSAAIGRRALSPIAVMVLVTGGTFRMGSDRPCPEEASVHRVTVDSFWMDRAPVTNREFGRFVEATGYLTAAEIGPDPNGYPGALPRTRKTGSLVFSPSDHPVDLSSPANWWTFKLGAKIGRASCRERV